MAISHQNHISFFPQHIQTTPMFLFNHSDLCLNFTPKCAFLNPERIELRDDIIELKRPCFRMPHKKRGIKKTNAPFDFLLKRVEWLLAPIQNTLTSLIFKPILPVASAEPLHEPSQLEEEKKDLSILETLSCIIRGRLEKIEPTCASMNFERPLEGKIQSVIQRIWKKEDLSKGCAPLTTYRSIDSLMASIKDIDHQSFAFQRLQCLQMKEKADYAYLFTSYVYPISRRLYCSNKPPSQEDAAITARCDAECEGILLDSEVMANETKWPLVKYIYGSISFICGFFFVLIFTKCLETWRSKKNHSRYAARKKPVAS